MPPATFDRQRPFLRAEGEAAGITAAAFRGGKWRQLVRGVYIDGSVPIDDHVRATAALLVAPRGTVVARHTAARLWGGAPPHDWRTHVTTLWPTAAERSTAAEARRHVRGGGRGCSARARAQLEWGRMDVDGVDARVSINHAGIVVHRGLRLTDPTRTFLDLAEDLDLVELVVVGDSLVSAGRVTPASLASAAATPGRHRRLARRAASLVRAGVDSPPETRTRLLCVLAGLPEPEVNVVFHDADGLVLRRADLGYRRARVSIEYDGRQHAEDDTQWARDLTRREEFDAWGWRMVVVTSPGLWREPECTLDRIVTVLRSRGQDVSVTSGEWRRYFGRPHERTA
ncbi:MAG TPA: hypothetical protein VES93_08115 [Ornithinibacter sp.]|nr:hypothetical protein [Ornithinibacter sp.]